MLHPLQTKVRRLGRQAWWLTWGYAAGWMFAAVLSAALVAGLADYWLRFQDQGVRIIVATAVLVVAALSVRRWWSPVARQTFDDLRIARRIERLFPQLDDRLSSAVEFLGQATDDPRVGSADLRRAVIAQATSLVESLDLSRCLETRPTRLAVAAACAVVLLTAGLSAADWRGAALAARRLVRPWSSEAWPRRHVLRFVDLPRRLAVGQDLEVTVVDDGGRLPDAVVLHYEFDDPESSPQSKELKLLPGDRMAGRLDHVTWSLRLRAVGGDDHAMPWQSIEVVEPPRWSDHTVRLVPPAYTRWPAESVPGKHIRTLAGTTIELHGRITRPASAVVLHVDSADGTTRLPLQLEPDGLAFSTRRETPWTAAASGTYWFELTDPEGLVSGGDVRWEVQVAKDQPPTVSLERPESNAGVTAEATVPVRALVKDDLALRSITLRFTRSDQPDSGEQSVELFAAAQPPAPSPPGERQGETRMVEHTWDLAPLGLMPGVWLDVSIAASDFVPQSGQSPPRRLTILSRDEFDERLAQRQASLVTQLTEALRVQRTARAPVTSLEIQLRETGRWAPRDHDQLQAAELTQRQVARLLGDPQDGAEALIAGLLAELANNRIDTSEVTRRLTELLTAVRRITREHLPVIQRELLAALKDVRPDAEPAPPAAGASLSAAGRGQDAVIAILEGLLDDLVQWDSYRRFAREIARLRRDQQEVQQQTDQQRAATLTKQVDQLTPQERSDIKRLAERQLDLARRFDKLQSRMNQARGTLNEDDPLAAATLDEALEATQRLAISGRMREGGRQIEQNKLGEASSEQQAIGAALDELLDVLQNRRERELSRLLGKLEEAAAELSSLQQQAKELQQRAAEAAKNPDEAERRRQLEKLTREQQAAAEKSEKLARRLERLQAERASQPLQQAGEQLGQAGKSAEGGEASQAEQRNREAQRLLDEAQQQLQQQIQQARQDLLHEQLTRLEQQIEGLVKRQQSVLDRTLEFDRLQRQQDDRLTREQLASVQDLAEAERGLVDEVLALSDNVSGAEAFRLGLRGAARDLDRAVQGLLRGEVNEPVQRSEKHALERLQQMLAALKADSRPNQPQEQPPPQPPQPPPGPMPPNNAVRALAELKLLKTMQESIHRRTTQLEEVRQRKGRLTDEQQSELDDLAREQGQLADLVFRLVKEVAPQEP